MTAQRYDVVQHSPTKTDCFGADVPIDKIGSLEIFIESSDALECGAMDQQGDFGEARLRIIRYQEFLCRKGIKVRACELPDEPEDRFKPRIA